MTVRLVNNGAGVTGFTTPVRVISQRASGPVQVQFASTGSVQLQGSIDGVNYHNVGSAIAASGLTTGIQYYPWMRANVTANAGGVAVHIDATKG